MPKAEREPAFSALVAEEEVTTYINRTFTRTTTNHTTPKLIMRTQRIGQMVRSKSTPALNRAPPRQFVDCPG